MVRPGNMYKALTDYGKDNYYIKDQSWTRVYGDMASELARAMEKGQEKHSVEELSGNRSGAGAWKWEWAWDFDKGFIDGYLGLNYFDNFSYNSYICLLSCLAYTDVNFKEPNIFRFNQGI